MFLVPADNPGFVLGEHLNTIDGTFLGGHLRVSLRDCFVPDDDVLGEPGRGFAAAQVRLAPARLTHCMRWLGAARRAHDIAVERAVGRELFGAAMTDLGMAQALIAENEIDLHAARAMLWHTAWVLAEGSRTSEESSRTKVFVSEAVCRVVDRSVQLAGGMGTSEDLVLGRIYRDIRSFRIYDGATEVHKMSIAKRAAKRAAARLAAQGTGPDSRTGLPGRCAAAVPTDHASAEPSAVPCSPRTARQGSPCRWSGRRCLLRGGSRSRPAWVWPPRRLPGRLRASGPRPVP
jgi:acyl-CoA dehydrogenase